MNKTSILRDSKEIYCGKVRITRFGGFICSMMNRRWFSPYFYERFKNYKPVLYCYEPNFKLNRFSEYSRFKRGATVWVHPNARISRDILRNSGYKITIDKDKAEGIIIPSIREDASCKLKVNIVAFDKVLCNTYMFHLYNEANSQISDEHVVEIKKSILKNIGKNEDEVDFYTNEYSSTLDQFCVFLIPPIEEWYDLIEERGINIYSPNNIYKLDCDVPVVPPFEINIETLEMCKRMDSVFLEKFLISCPYKEYPLTLHYFLKNEFRGLKFSNNNNVRMVLDAIHFYNADLESTMQVNPKDLNMLQDWIFHCLGLDGESKAFIDANKVFGLHEDYKDFIRKRFAVSKISAEEPISLDEIFEIAKN